MKILFPLDPNDYQPGFAISKASKETKKRKHQLSSVQMTIGFFQRWFAAQPVLFAVSELATQVSEGMMAPNGVPLLLGKEFFQENEKNLKANLAAAKSDFQKMGKGISPVTEIANGHAVGEILKRAAQKDIGSICIPTHGRKGLSRVLLGSVTEEVIRHSHKPSIVLGPLAQSNKLSFGKQITVAIATDLTSESVHWEKKFLQWFLRPAGAPCTVDLVLVHSYYSVLHPIEKSAVAFAGVKKNRGSSGRDSRYIALANQVNENAQIRLEKRVEQWEHWLEDMASTTKGSGVGGVHSISGHLNTDMVNSSDALVKMESKIKPDFWVTGTHSRGQIAEAFLGSTVRHLILKSKIPVVVIPTK